MRCAAKFTVIAQCLAAYMWHRAGLLTKDDCDELIGEGVLSADDNGKEYKPHECERFTYKIHRLAKPIYGENPLEVEEAGNTTVLGYYKEWKELLFEEILKIYVEQAYERDSLRKRSVANAVDSATFINEHAAELEQLFSSSERLRKSYSYARCLLSACDYAYYRFRDVINAITVNANSYAFSKFVKGLQGEELDSLDGAKIDDLNRSRMTLDNPSGMASRRSFPHRKYNGILGPSSNTASRIINDQFMDNFKECCKEALAYIYSFPEEISREIVWFATRCRGRDSPEDPYEHLHYVYPELDYEGWGSFWREALIQVTTELKALERHVNDVANFRSNNLEVEPELFEEMDNAFNDVIFAINTHNATYPDHTIVPTSRLISKIIPGEIENVAKRVSTRICEAIVQETRTDKAESTGEQKKMEE
ncbi:hypothetical protein PAPHI01_2081 [Pancytospora philotis]|nr:hypothetical protein PAPHI01_2081 [Pancytospora philotis]